MVLLTSMTNKKFFTPKLLGIQREDMQRDGEFILDLLVEKLGENLVKTRKTAEEAIIGMCNSTQNFGPKMTIAALVKPAKNKGKATGIGGSKSINSNK